MTAPSLSLATVHLDVPQASALQAALVRGLRRPGLTLVDSADRADTVVAPLEKLPKSPGARAVALFDGKLGPEQATRLREDGSHFFLSCRGDELVPTDWELDVLARMLAGEPLLPEGEEGKVERYYVGQLSGLRMAQQRAAALAQEAGGGKAAAEVVGDVMYELAANAVLDAPSDGNGPKYAHRRDDASLTIAAEDTALVAMAALGGRIFLLAQDRFGRLSREPFARTFDGLTGRAKVNDSGGGAGLGLRRIIEQSELVAARVVEGRSTEVLSVVELKDVRRRAANPKSFFFSIERG